MKRAHEEARLTICKEFKQQIEPQILSKAKLVIRWELG